MVGLVVSVFNDSDPNGTAAEKKNLEWLAFARGEEDVLAVQYKGFVSKHDGLCTNNDGFLY